MTFFSSFRMSILVLSATLISACGKSSSNNDTSLLLPTFNTYQKVDDATITSHFQKYSDNEYWIKAENDIDPKRPYGIAINKDTHYIACYPSDQVKASTKNVVYKNINYYYKNNDTKVIYLITGNEDPENFSFDESQIIGTYDTIHSTITQNSDINHSGLSGGQFYKIGDFDFHALHQLLTVCNFNK